MSGKQNIKTTPTIFQISKRNVISLIRPFDPMELVFVPLHPGLPVQLQVADFDTKTSPRNPDSGRRWDQKLLRAVSAQSLCPPVLPFMSTV